MEPSLIAPALILSSALGVWGLIKLWQRNIARGPAVEAPAPRRTDPMYAALHHSGIICRGAPDFAPTLPAGGVVTWSATVPGPAALTLLWVDGDPDLAAVCWPQPGDAEAWLAAAEAARADLGRFGDNLELSHAHGHGWLMRSHPQPPVAFDLLCHLAAAAWLTSVADQRDPPLLPGDLVPVSWVEADWACGELPPFGRLRLTATELILQAPSRLPRPGDGGALPGPPTLLPCECRLPRAGLAVSAITATGLQLLVDGRSVHVTLLAGSMLQAATALGLAPPGPSLDRATSPDAASPAHREG